MQFANSNSVYHQEDVPNEAVVKFQQPIPPSRSSYCSDVLPYDGGLEIPKLENINKIKKSGMTDADLIFREFI